jgi:hypothetical protein
MLFFPAKWNSDVYGFSDMKYIPRHRTLTMMPWLSSIESTYRPDPEQVAQWTAPLALHRGHLGLFPMDRRPFGSPVGFSIFSSGTPVSQ